MDKETIFKEIRNRAIKDDTDLGDIIYDVLNGLYPNELKEYDFTELAPKNFLAPQLDLDLISRKKLVTRIAYDVNKDLADLARDHAEAKSYKELGNITFDYYLKMEDISNE